jgi:hypothetical protein
VKERICLSGKQIKPAIKSIRDLNTLSYRRGDQADWEPRCAMTEVRMYLHLLDLKEFMRFVGMARGSKDRLDYLLIERVKHFIEHKTVHLKSREVFNNEK